MCVIALHPPGLEQQCSCVCCPQAELHHQLLSAEEAWVPRVAAAQREACAAEACLWQGRLAAAQQALEAAASRAERLQAELQSARAGVPWTPRAQEVSGTGPPPVPLNGNPPAAGPLVPHLGK